MSLVVGSILVNTANGGLELRDFTAAASSSDGGAALEARVRVQQGRRRPAPGRRRRRRRRRRRGRRLAVVGHLNPVPFGRELLDKRAVAVSAIINVLLLITVTSNSAT